MKFQHLILPCALWLSVGLIIAYISPESPVVIGSVLCILFFAVYCSVRIFTHSKAPLIFGSCAVLFLLSSILSGFSFINLLLIGAIGTLISILLK